MSPHQRGSRLEVRVTWTPKMGDRWSDKGHILNRGHRTGKMDTGYERKSEVEEDSRLSPK